MPTRATYDSYAPDSSESHFKHSGKLLLILFVLIIPALALLYVSTRFHVRIIFMAALWLNLFLIGCAGIVIIISGVLGLFEERKYRALAHPNSHPKPRR